MSPWEPPPRERSPSNPGGDTKPPPRASISHRAAARAAGARRQEAAAKAGRMPSGGRLRPLPLAARCGPSAAGRPSIPHSGEGEAGGAANAASRGAARGRGARRCWMRRRAPFPLMSPPRRPASRASRCSNQREGRMPDLRFVVFAARRKPPTTSWSRDARAGGHRTLTRRGNRGPRLSRGAAMVAPADPAPGHRAEHQARGPGLNDGLSQSDQNMATRSAEVDGR